MQHPPKLAFALQLLDQAHDLMRGARHGGNQAAQQQMIADAQAMRAHSQKLAREHHGPIYRGRC